jgi:hypothetical protein
MRNPFRSPKPHGLSQLARYGVVAFRNGDLFSSLIIFDYLSRHSKLWYPYYRFWCRKCMDTIRVELGASARLNTKKHTKRGITIRLLDTLISMNYPREELEKAIDTIPETGHRALLHACLCAGRELTAWQDNINHYLEKHQLRPLQIEGYKPSANILDCLRFQPAPQSNDAGLVTIFISAYNSAATLPYAIESILQQDYQNFELLIADDASTDHTRQIIEDYAARHPRITPLLNPANKGTYWNRNVALQKANGRYFTILDADDFCHPQRISIQVEVMQDQPKLAGVFSHWLRVQPEGRLVFRNWGASYLHEAIATLLIDREKVLPAIGYYDEVRFSADTEYVERIKRFFGSRSVCVIRKPLTFALAHGSSLTAEQSSGIHNYLGLSRPRRAYRVSWKKWHTSSPINDLFIDFHAKERKFTAPHVMLVSNDDQSAEEPSRDRASGMQAP